VPGKGIQINPGMGFELHPPPRLARRKEQVNGLGAGPEDLRAGDLSRQENGLLVDRSTANPFRRVPPVDGISEDVEETPQQLSADRGLQGTAGVEDRRGGQGCRRPSAVAILYGRA
jgi:hypothetical protein